MAKILSFDYVREELEARHRWLVKSGFDVSSVERKNDALRLLLKSQRFDILMIGCGVPVSDRNEVALKGRLQQKTRVIFFYKGNIAHAESADALLSVDSSPDDLNAAIWRLLQHPRENFGLSQTAY